MNKRNYLAIFTIFISIIVGCTDQTTSSDPSLKSPQILHCSKDSDCKGDSICEKGICSNSQRILNAHSSVATQSEVKPPKAITTDTTPHFKDYPSGPVYTGHVASLADKSDMFRTLNSEALAEKPVMFASEYVISTIGCGAGCAFQIFLSKKTGKQLDDVFGGEGPERIKLVNPDSLLVVTAGQNNAHGDEPRFYAYYYVLKNGKFEKIYEEETILPECKDVEGYCTTVSPY
jgi:hypothetical protein